MGNELTSDESYQLVIEFIQYVQELSIKAITESKSLDELEHVRRLTIGKKGIYTLMIKDLGKLIKEDRLCQQ